MCPLPPPPRQLETKIQQVGSEVFGHLCYENVPWASLVRPGGGSLCGISVQLCRFQDGVRPPGDPLPEECCRVGCPGGPTGEGRALVLELGPGGRLFPFPETPLSFPSLPCLLREAQPQCFALR